MASALLRPAAARRARLDAAVLGRGRRPSRPRRSRSTPCRRATPRSATRAPASTTRSGRWRRCWSCRARARGRGLGRRPVAAELREAGRRAAARPAVEGAPTAVRIRAGSRRGRRAAARGRRGTSGRGRRRRRRTPACRPSGPAHARRRPAGARPRSRSSRSRGPSSRTRRSRVSSAGRRATRRSSQHLEPADILVDGMRGRSALWYRVRVNLIHVPGGRPAGPGAARPRLRPVGRPGHRGVEGGDGGIARPTPGPEVEGVGRARRRTGQAARVTRAAEPGS